MDHIKKFHINVVDDEVLKSLESDLKKSRKKAAKQATLQNGMDDMEEIFPAVGPYQVSHPNSW